MLVMNTTEQDSWAAPRPPSPEQSVLEPHKAPGGSQAGHLAPPGTWARGFPSASLSPWPPRARSLSVDLPVLDVSRQWGHTPCVLLCLLLSLSVMCSGPSTCSRVRASLLFTAASCSSGWGDHILLQIKDLETERLFGIIRVGPQCHHKAPYTREAQGDSTRTEEPRRWGSGRRTGSRAQKRQETASPWTPGRNQPCRRRDSSPGRLTGARPPGLWRDATWSRWPLVGAALGDPHRRRSRSPSASAPRRREPSSERAPGHVLRGLGPQRLLSLCPSGPLAVCVVRGPNRARLSHTRHFPKAQTPVAPCRVGRPMCGPGICLCTCSPSS